MQYKYLSKGACSTGIGRDSIYQAGALLPRSGCTNISCNTFSMSFSVEAITEQTNNANHVKKNTQTNNTCSAAWLVYIGATQIKC